MTLYPGDRLENQENEGALDDSGKSICMHPFFQIVFTPGIGGSLVSSSTHLFHFEICNLRGDLNFHSIISSLVLEFHTFRNLSR